jgi:hypothetical protein
MKFKDVIKNINCKYELEVYDGGKIIRVKRSTKTLVNGIIVETPNDMAFYFDSSDNLTQQIGCETMIDEKSIDEAINDKNKFEVKNNQLSRKKI